VFPPRAVGGAGKGISVDDEDEKRSLFADFIRGMNCCRRLIKSELSPGLMEPAFPFASAVFSVALLSSGVVAGFDGAFSGRLSFPGVPVPASPASLRGDLFGGRCGDVRDDDPAVVVVASPMTVIMTRFSCVTLFQLMLVRCPVGTVGGCYKTRRGDTTSSILSVKR